LTVTTKVAGDILLGRDARVAVRRYVERPIF